MEHERRHRITRLVAALRSERGENTPQTALALSVVSGTSLVHFTSLPQGLASALAAMVRLVA